MIQYNRSGIKDIESSDSEEKTPKIEINSNLKSLLRLFLVIMIFVVIVLSIAK